MAFFKVHDQKKVKTFFSILLVVSFVGSGLLAMDDGYKPPKTLRAAIKLALILNPKTRSKDVQVEAMHGQTLAARDRMFPSGSVNCDYTKISQSTNDPTGKYNNYPVTKDCGLGLSMTLWDSGANRYAYKAAQAEEREMQSRFNSTNPLILNTKGSLANSTMEAYLNLVMNEEILKRADYENHFLDLLLQITKSEEDRNRIMTFRSNLEASMAQAQARYQTAESHFNFVVTLPPSPEMEDFSATIESLEIPETPEQAMQVALEKSPDIRATNYGLEAAEYQYKSAKAALGPQVQLNLFKDRNYIFDSALPNSLQRIRANTVMVTLSMPLSLSRYHYLKSQRKFMEAAQLEKDAALDDVQYNIKSTYQNLLTQIHMEKIYRRNVEDMHRIIDEIIQKIQNHDPSPPTIQYSLDQLNSLGDALDQWQGTQAEIVSLKFSVQQVTGTLFDSNT